MNSVGWTVLVFAFVSGVVGFGLLSITRSSWSLLAAGFFLTLGRTGLAVGLSAMFWDMLTKISIRDEWPNLLIATMSVVVIGALLYHAVSKLALCVAFDVYGSKRPGSNRQES